MHGVFAILQPGGFKTVGHNRLVGLSVGVTRKLDQDTEQSFMKHVLDEVQEPIQFSTTQLTLSKHYG